MLMFWFRWHGCQTELLLERSRHAKGVGVEMRIEDENEEEESCGVRGFRLMKAYQA